MIGQVSQMENGPVDWVLVGLDLGTYIYCRVPLRYSWGVTGWYLVFVFSSFLRSFAFNCLVIVVEYFR